MFPFPATLQNGGSGGPCVWDPTKLEASSPTEATVSGLLLTATAPASVLGTVRKRSGKYYFEVAIHTNVFDPVVGGVGLSQQPNSASPYNFGASGYGVQYYSDGSLTDHDTFGVISGYGPTFNAPPGSTVIVQAAADLTNGLIWFGINGTFVGNPAAGTGGQPILKTTYYPAIWANVSNFPGVNIVFSAAFNAPFAYSPPLGFGQWR